MLRIEQQATAQDQGSHAAFNMLGKCVPYGNVPVYSNEDTMYVGDLMGHDEFFYDGDP